ncbi:uncharacterized protein LOC128391269 [Panonychus citri]|uniref:uncharacterized protein LOC128391269 n=1 Tax=Panonychus citri TaxID=50023 RepID=UPI0023077C1B|nr:uncharacterized protein LOC128391269 [Panonychus citri]
MAPQSIYGSRSTTSLASARSRCTITHSLPGSRKLELKWWQRRPIIENALFIDLQKGSYIAAIYTLIESLMQIILAVFDTYCLFEAAPGSKHFRSVGISFLFVYSGNEHIRRSLIACSLILILISIYLLISSIILIPALKKEQEIRFKNWLRAMSTFIIVRTCATLFQSIANDLFFTYHQLMLLLWFLASIANVFAFLVVVSNYQELNTITRLEDMAKLKMSTISSLNASRTLSHHSLDSYRGPHLTTNPSPNTSIQGTPTALRGSHASSDSYNHYYPQPSPRLGNPPSASSIPLAAFSLNLNPNGTFSAARSAQGSIGGGSLSAGRGSTPSTAPI